MSCFLNKLILCKNFDRLYEVLNNNKLLCLKCFLQHSLCNILLPLYYADLNCISFSISSKSATKYKHVITVANLKINHNLFIRV